jgi:hypothetical protein
MILSNLHGDVAADTGDHIGVEEAFTPEIPRD